MQPGLGEEKNELCDGFLSRKVFNCFAQCILSKANGKIKLQSEASF